MIRSVVRKESYRTSQGWQLSVPALPAGHSSTIDGSWRGGGAVTGRLTPRGDAFGSRSCYQNKLRWRARQVSGARYQPTPCRSRVGMSGSKRPGDWHERRVPSRRTLAASDTAPDGRARRLRRCWRVGPGRRRTRGHPAEHREASPCRPPGAVRSDDRATDLRRPSIRSARRAESGADEPCRVATTRRAERKALTQWGSRATSRLPELCAPAARVVRPVEQTPRG
jgi:hypothetical protein